jgi:hypothetical protein
MLSRHHAARSSARWIAWVSACALLALVGVGVGVLVHIPKSGNGPLASPTRPTEKSPIPGPLLAGSQQEASAVESRSRLAAPVMFVSELSDPELEAWLDLRQEGVEEQIAF